MIKFSIITVCLNAGADLLNTVTSTLNQTYHNYEIIVKDGISKDGSVEVLPKCEKLRVISKKDNGIYDAMNQAIAEATGDYLIFMNAGDLFYTDTVLEQLESYISNNPDVSFFYGKCYNQSLDVVDPAPKQLTEYFCYRSMICHQATIYKKEMLVNRAYDLSYKVGADRERMLYAVLTEKVESLFVPIIVVNYKDGGFCATEKARVLMQEEHKRMRDVYYSAIKKLGYNLRHQLTLPWLRSKLLANDKVVKYYRKFIGKLYELFT